jgi:antitoxin ParD1/3/4
MADRNQPLPIDPDHRDRDRQSVIAEIQDLIDEGLASGPPQPFDMQTFLAERERR